MESAAEPVRDVKKKILILSSKGGYGHAAASLSIQEIGKDQYSFREVFPIEQINRFGTRSGENLYNTLIKNNWIRTTNFLSNKLAPLLFQVKQDLVESLMKEYIQEEKPDLVLSLIPFINYPASEAARKCGIPYLLVTTDNDLTNWVLGLEKVKHPAFKVSVGIDHALTKGLLRSRGIPEESIELTGLPVHPAFSEEKNEQVIKEEIGIPLNKPVVTIMMGGAGGKGAYAYAKELQKVNFPLHVVICTGNNSILYQKMQDLAKLEGDVSFSVLKFMNKVADLMQVSDLLITKPGPGTINEAMQRKLPILVDNTNSTLSWERTNLDFVKRTGLGQVLDSTEEVRKWVPLYLRDKEVKKEVLKAYERLETPAFDKNIQKLICSLLSSEVCV